MRFVVAGTWRGGTNFACNVLRDLGVDCTHEAVFQSATTDWSKAREAEVSPCAHLHLDFIQWQRVPVVHLLRPKMDVVASLNRWGGPVTEDLGSYWERTHAAIRKANPIATINIGTGSLYTQDDFIRLGNALEELYPGVYTWDPGEILKSVLAAPRNSFDDIERI